MTRVVTEWGKPRWWWGWADFGPIQIPPLPPFIIMVDRNDGVTQWLLSWNGVSIPTGDGLGMISIRNDNVPSTSPRAVIYGPFDGPYVGTSKLNVSGVVVAPVKLFVRSGLLGYEYQTGSVQLDDAASTGWVMAQQVSQNLEYRQIVIPASFNFPPDLIGWTRFVNSAVGPPSIG